MSEINFKSSDGLSKGVNEFRANPIKVKRFVRHILIASKKLNSLNEARNNLKTKLNDMRNLSNKPAKVMKVELDSHIDELISRVNFLIESEKKIVRLSKQNSISNNNEFQEKISTLQKEIDSLRNENQKINTLSETIKELESKLENYENLKSERDKRLEELESKIKDRVDKSDLEILSIEETLKSLSNRYSELADSGKHSEDDLSNIKSRIEDLTIILNKKKSSNQKK